MHDALVVRVKPDSSEGVYGERGPTAFIAGAFDNSTLPVRFYRRVLTDDEILQLASAR